MRRTFGIFFTVAVLAASFVPGTAGALVGRDAPATGDRFDVRAGAPGLGATRGQAEAVLALVREIPSVTLRWNARFGTPGAILSYEAALTGPSAGTPDAAARAWLSRHAALFGWDDLAALRTIKTLRQPNGGPVAVLYHQTFGDLEAGQGLGGSLVVALDRANRILSVRGDLVRTPSLAGGRLLPAAAAFKAATGARTPKVAGAKAGWTVLDRGPFGGNHYVRRVAFPMGGTPARPAWEVLFVKGSAEAYRVVVDAVTGTVLYRRSLVDFEAPEGRIFRNYPGAKRGGAHEIASFKGDPAASPQGWFSPVSSGAPALTTIGNNATTATNWIAFIAPDGPGQIRPVSADGVFDFAFTDAWRESNCGSNPISDATRTADTPAYAEDAMPAALNLFYHHNVMHDFFYGLGFNEEAGNLQANNFGKGGLQEDPLFGLVQAGAIAGDVPGAEVGRDNAYMLTLPDGLPSWSGMFLFETIPGAVVTPCTDGDFDAPVIYHEYTHAVSTRWVGGEWGNLSTHQGGSMGESWSDFYALHYLHKHGLESTGALGPYVTGDYVRGIRNYPIDGNPLGFGDIGYDIIGPEVHSDGEIWNAVLWDIRTALGKARAGGTDLAAQLIADAMPISGANPSMLNMRDAILTADRARTNGQNQALLWQVFARRGMGVSASTVDAEDTEPKPAYDSGVKAQNGTVTLRVVDEATGAPVPAARLLLSAFEVGIPLIGRTAMDGTTTLKWAANTYPVKIVAQGYGSRTVPVVVEAGSTTERTVKIRVNYASAGSGGRIVSTTNASALGSASLAIDDIEATTWRPSDEGSVGEESFIIDLAGTSPVLVQEIRMSARPISGTGRWPTLKDWEIQASLDGKTFSPLTKGSFGGAAFRPLASTLGFRGWRLAQPVAATFLKIIAKSAHGEDAESIQLAEVQVFGRGAPLKIAHAKSLGETHHAEGAVLVASADVQLSRLLITGEAHPLGLDADVAAPVPCMLPPASQGIDAYLFEVPESYGDGTHTFKVQLVPTIADPRGDPDIYFYSADCRETGSHASVPAPEFENPPEIGLIPQGTRYILAQHYSTLPGTMVLDAASEKFTIPAGKPKPKPTVKGERLPATGIATGVAGGLSLLATAGGVVAWMRPRRRRR